VVNFVLSAIIRSTGLCGSLLFSYLKVLIGRRRAMRRFRKTLVEEGVPIRAAGDIARRYPEVPIPWKIFRRSVRVKASPTTRPRAG